MKSFKVMFFICLAITIIVAAIDCAEGSTFEQLRENGTLLLLVVFGIFGGFYLLCVAICLLAGEIEKRVGSNNRKKRQETHELTAPDSPKTSYDADYIMPRARNYSPRKKTRRKVAKY